MFLITRNDSLFFKSINPVLAGLEEGQKPRTFVLNFTTERSQAKQFEFEDALSVSLALDVLCREFGASHRYRRC